MTLKYVDKVIEIAEDGKCLNDYHKLFLVTHEGVNESKRTHQTVCGNE